MCLPYIKMQKRAGWSCIAKTLITLFVVFVIYLPTVHSYEVIYAVNCGGDDHIDSNGIRYERDPLMGKVGTDSDYGKQLLSIGRVREKDLILYQTERYHHSTFGYDIPIDEDGEYVMVLKFSEVYFSASDRKVFDIVLNGDHTVVTELDIFDKVGRGVAHDEYVVFKVVKDKLIINGEESEILGGKIRVEFIKGYKDNPKINAILVIKGTLEEVPKLGPIPQEPEEYGMQDEEEEPVIRTRHTSGPRSPDPYADDSSFWLPVFITLGLFIPLVICLCKW
ncbi:malectin-A [Copidosoma floridanum]|uniref:malectin-A n=1 Tax=Copidosoma floridanum TaxID=29053 RepID=UPI0006C94A56|nr:malectin-A [Copidosoma floridanum]